MNLSCSTTNWFIVEEIFQLVFTQFYLVNFLQPRNILAKTLTGKQLFCGRTPEGKYAAKRKHFSRSIYFACALLKICAYIYKAKGVNMGDENTKRPTKYVLFLYQNL